MRVHTAPRADAYPEHIEYRDTGCDLYPSCLSCPLPQCRYDVTPSHVGTVPIEVANARLSAVATMRDSGAPADVIADTLGISKRTVYRYFRRAAHA